MTDRKKTILIFGGGGFIGSHFVERYHQEYNILVFDKKYFSRKNIQPYENSVDVVEGDFQNFEDWIDLVKDADYVLHLVWSTLPESSNTIYDVESNIIPTLKLLDVLKENRGKRIIFVSSGGTVYGNPTQCPIRERDPTMPICSYGLTKLTAEKYLYLYNYLYGLDYVVARLSNPYGERQERNKRQGLIAYALSCAVDSNVLTIWGDGNVKRDYIYIGDAVACVEKIVKYSGSERVFNVSSETGYTINEIVDCINEITGKKIETRYETARKFDIKENVLSNVLSKKELHWQPETVLKDGISRVYNYLTRNTQ